MNPDDFLCFAVYAASHSFNRAYKALLGEIGLTYPQYLVMARLWQQAPLMVSQLGEMVDLESSTLTPMLKRLEAAGLISRSRSSADERQVHIGLTEAGLALREKASRIPGCIGEATGLSPEAIGRMTQELKALRSSLDKHGETAAA